MYIKSGSDRKLEEKTKVPVSELRFTQIDRGGLGFWTEAKRRCSLDRTNAHKSRSRGSMASYVKKTKACRVTMCLLHWSRTELHPRKGQPPPSPSKRFLPKNSVLLWKPEDKKNLSDWSVQRIHLFMGPFTTIMFQALSLQVTCPRAAKRRMTLVLAPQTVWDYGLETRRCI